MSALAAELDAIALGDLRLNRRARRLLETLGEKPTVSIPAACGGWDETRAAYRLFDHPEVSAKRVLAPHIARTEQRLREHPRVLCRKAHHRTRLHHQEGHRRTRTVELRDTLGDVFASHPGRDPGSRALGAARPLQLGA
jgi:hypothetical protein